VSNTNFSEIKHKNVELITNTKNYSKKKAQKESVLKNYGTLSLVKFIIKNYVKIFVSDFRKLKT